MTRPPVRPPIVPERIRQIEPGGFAFIPNRFLHDGFFSSLQPEERSLYLLLVLAGERRGISFYRYDTICSILEVTLDDYIRARNALVEKDLIATDGIRTQVLSLPARPVHRSRGPLRSDAELESADPSTIRSLILGSLDHDDT